MKSHLLFVSLLAATGAAGQDGVDANHQKALLAEVRKLRIELLEFRIEAQATKIPVLELGLNRIEAQRLKLAEEERTVPQQIASINAQLTGQSLTPDQRAELDALRSTFAAVQAERVSTERSSLEAREAETPPRCDWSSSVCRPCRRS